MATRCPACGSSLGDRGSALADGRFVLVRGRNRQPHCSALCLRDSLRARRIARLRILQKVAVGAAAIAFVVSSTRAIWRRFHAPRPQSISLAWPGGPVNRDLPPSHPLIFYGPAWPPTDEDWIRVFDGAKWVHPLPGPVRRVPTVDARLFGPEAPRGLPPSCREPRHCGVDLGGELWGEHVYAALDGVVDRVQGDGNEARGGQYVRLSHFGGMVFTQYFHLASTPRLLHRGSRVRAGDVIGLLGDTGTGSRPRHLHFTLSVRPSAELPEVYWDPAARLATWPLHRPLQGSVAGYAPPEVGL